MGGPLLLVGMAAIPGDAGLLRGYAPRLLVVYGPGIAALVLAGASGRGDGVSGLLRRLFPRPGDWPRAATILVAGAAASAVALLVAGVHPAELAWAVRAHGGLLVAHLGLQVAVVAVGEELGWRGWLLPRMAARTTRLRATLATGAIWGLWHGPLLLAGVGSAVLFLLFVLGISAVFTWLWEDARGRLFTVVIAHATVNAPLFFWEQVSAGGRDSDHRVRHAWYVLQAVGIAAGLALVLTRWRWWTASSELASASPHSAEATDS